MAEKTAAEYLSSGFDIEPDFYKARLVAYEYIEGGNRFNDKGEAYKDSYKLSWEVPAATDEEFWDFVNARFGNKGNDGTPFPLQATVDALTGSKVDMAALPYSEMTPSAILNDLIGKEMELYIEPILSNGKVRNKVTKRRPLKIGKEK